MKYKSKCLEHLNPKQDGCGVNESSFTSPECLSCERGFCKFEAQKNESTWQDKIIEGLPDQKKAEMTECPFCDQSFELGWSEVDADGFCRVTCAGCEKYIEYKIEFVTDEGVSEVQELKDKITDLMEVVNFLYSMRNMLRDKVILLDWLIEDGGDLLSKQYWKGQRSALLDSLSLLKDTNFAGRERGDG